jgi:hypothetical protein
MLVLRWSGKIWGYRALIPRNRVKEYERKSLPELLDQDGISIMTGAFSLLLKQSPTIIETIDNLYLGRNKMQRRVSDIEMSVSKT